MKSVTVTRKLPNISDSKPLVNGMRNQTNFNKPVKQFSVRKTNTNLNPKHGNKNFKVFEQAKNTILGNIQILDRLK